MKVVASTGTYDTAHSVELTRRAAEIGCDGVMAVTPYYSKPPQEGLYRHFVAIADASDLPVLLYNIPGRTARLIDVDTLVRLAGHPNVVAVKDAVDDLDYTKRSLAELPGDFAVYSGSDVFTFDSMQAGGVGVVSVASHLVGLRLEGDDRGAPRRSGRHRRRNQRRAGAAVRGVVRRAQPDAAQGRPQPLVGAGRRSPAPAHPGVGRDSRPSGGGAHPRRRRMTVSLSFLGGLGEIGRNCAVLEAGGRLALIDCGLMFPEEEMLGVDLVLPDFSWVVDRRRDVACVVLTHGHEDHVGALAYFLRQVPVPVYGTPLTVELARSRVEELNISADFNAVPPGEWIEQGPFRFALVAVAHSVPQATGVVFDTDEGLIVHSGDFKLDPTPIDGTATDLGAFAGFGRMGVRLLLADSTNAEVPGFTPSEATIGRPIAELTSRAEGRVIIACFASHVHRVQQAVDAVVGAGRKLAFLGRSMLRNTEVAGRLGLLDVPEGSSCPSTSCSPCPPSRPRSSAPGARVSRSPPCR